MFFCQISISDAVYASVNFKLSAYSPVLKEICISLHIFLGDNYFDMFTKMISTPNITSGILRQCLQRFIRALAVAG